MTLENENKPDSYRLAKVTDFPDIKIHVDAAWAGMALVCPEFREMCYLKDINAIADSFSTNFHKVSVPWYYDRIVY